MEPKFKILENESWTWDQIKEFVDCDMMQEVPLANGDMLYVDEEAKGFDPPKPVNNSATIYCGQYLLPGDYVVGNAMVLRGEARLMPDEDE